MDSSWPGGTVLAATAMSGELEHYEASDVSESWPAARVS